MTFFTKILVLVLVTIVLAWGIWCLLTPGPGTPYSTYFSPDGRFKVVVYRRASWLAFPGQSGDAPGYVQLLDAQGNVLAEKEITSAGSVDWVDWSEYSVFHPEMGAFGLPARK